MRGEDGLEARADSGVARELGGAAGGMKFGPDLSVLSTGRGGRGVRLLMQQGGGKGDDEDATSDGSQLLPRRQEVCRWAPGEGALTLRGLKGYRRPTMKMIRVM